VLLSCKNNTAVAAQKGRCCSDNDQSTNDCFHPKNNAKYAENGCCNSDNNAVAAQIGCCGSGLLKSFGHCFHPKGMQRLHQGPLQQQTQKRSAWRPCSHNDKQVEVRSSTASPATQPPQCVLPFWFRAALRTLDKKH
jgi:hypothetical protein